MSLDAMSDDAYECALRALHHRDRTEHEIEQHLRDRGFSEADRARTLGALRRTGLVDDERFAHARAASLAERGAGNALIRARLADAGVPDEVVAAALDTVGDETTRARHIVERRGGSPKTVRYLYGKGFSDDVIRAVIADRDDGELG
ncbi:MAG: regulatory protein RecX [Gaiellaceae bacterium]